MKTELYTLAALYASCKYNKNINNVNVYRNKIQELKSYSLFEVKNIAKAIVIDYKVHYHNKYDFNRHADEFLKERDSFEIDWLTRISNLLSFDDIPKLSKVPQLSYGSKLNSEDIIEYLKAELDEDEILLLASSFRSYEIIDLLRLVAIPDYKWCKHYERNHSVLYEYEKLISYVYETYPHCREYCKEVLEYDEKLSIDNMDLFYNKNQIKAQAMIILSPAFNTDVNEVNWVTNEQIKLKN